MVANSFSDAIGKALDDYLKERNSWKPDTDSDFVDERITGAR